MNSLESDEPSRLPRSLRKLSRFVASELLYDYMMGRLDSDRQKAMHEHLQDSPELQEELKTMQVAENYLENIARTKISSHHLSELAEYRTTTEHFFSRLQFANWPVFMRWVAEALLVSFAVAALALFIPWDKITSNITNSIPTAKIPDEVIPAMPQEPVEQKIAEANKTETTPEPAQKAPVEAVVAQASKDVQKPQTAPSKVEVTTIVKSEKPKVSALNGFVYSMMMSLTDTATLTPEIRAKIEELGGIKAGQVELGWRKQNPAGSYFHFSMPEENYDQLVQTLGGYGRVRIYKNPHERVMPEGKIRIILWVEDNAVETQEDEEKPVN